MQNKKRAIILQSGGSTAVINQSLAGVIEQAQKSKLFDTLLGSKFGILGVLRNEWVNLLATSNAQLKHLKSTPSSALGSCRHKLSSPETEQVLRTLQAKKINVMFFIGGNDSAETGLALSALSKKRNYNLQVIGIPKTIDNDLPGMDHAPGYGSVARFFAIATQEASFDTRAIRYSDPVKIIETMGRNSGWIVAASALAKRRSEDGPHLLYFPERPFSEVQFVEDVQKVYQKFGYVVVVISETIRNAKGERIGRVQKQISKDRFGHPYVEGAAQYLCNLVEAKLRLRARFDKPGTIQRMSLPYISVTDQKEAYQCGAHAVKFALEGKSGIEVAMKRISNRPYQIKYEAVPILQVAGQEKKLPNSFINRQGNFITDQFRKYALPLVGGSFPDYTFFV